MGRYTEGQVVTSKLTGREGTIEKVLSGGRYLVRFDDGTEMLHAMRLTPMQTTNPRGGGDPPSPQGEETTTMTETTQHDLEGEPIRVMPPDHSTKTTVTHTFETDKAKFSINEASWEKKRRPLTADGAVDLAKAKSPRQIVQLGVRITDPGDLEDGELREHIKALTEMVVEELD